MKKSFFLSIVMAFALICTVNVKADEAKLLDIADTLKMIESNNNPDAIGDGGKAFGVLQIHEASILDVNRYYGTDYTHEDAFNPVIAEDIFIKYLTLGIKLYKERCGVEPTTNQIVRMWNGGIYKGFEYESTKPYLNKFLKYRGIKLIEATITKEILVSDMPKFLTKSEAVSKFKLEWVPTLKKNGTTDFKEAWDLYKQGLYDTAQINTGGLSWKYPNDIA